tara:strand:- start:54 stop:614 length:561 start_codon:yes stop_codon:yes gene_type:complete
MYKEDCWKCNGSGVLPHYFAIFDGQCFACNGRGYRAYKTSPEVRAKNRERAAAKREVERAAREEKFAAKRAELEAARAEREAKWAAERAAELAAAEDVPEGRIAVAGEVLKVVRQENPFAYNEWMFKMLVKDDRGFKVWGAQPRALRDAEAGDRVEFVAALMPSNDDPKFGFFKRPARAALLNEEA